MNRRIALYALFAGCALFALLLLHELAAPAGEEAPPVAVAASPKPAPAALRPPREDSARLMATIIARPLFDPTRRPPEDGGGAGASAALDDSRLTAIITEPGRRLAIFAVPNAKPLVLTEGETMNGWRIDSITPVEVSLSGPDGSKTLQPKADPNLVFAAKPVPNVAGAPTPGRPGLPPIRPGLPAVPPQMRVVPPVQGNFPVPAPGVAVQRE